jgi:ribosomal protein S18 acetylase RimI-like enzyme
MDPIAYSTASLRDLRQTLRLERICFGGDAWPLLDVMSVLVWPGGVRWKASCGRRMVGLAIAETGWGSGISMITTLGVDPEFRRRGIGSELLARCEADLPDGRVRLTVRADNQPAIRLYEKSGYSFLSRVPDYYRDGQPGLVLEKKNARH